MKKGVFVGIFECIEELVMGYELCAVQDCDRCPYIDSCTSVFGKKQIIDEIECLSAQCKAFNQFARANKKGQE